MGIRLGFIGFAQHSRIIPFTYRLWQWFHGKWGGRKTLKKHQITGDDRVKGLSSLQVAQEPNQQISTKPTCNSGSMLEAKIADLKICIKADTDDTGGGGAMKVHMNAGAEVSTCMLGGEEFNEAV